MTTTSASSSRSSLLGLTGLGVALAALGGQFVRSGPNPEPAKQILRTTVGVQSLCRNYAEIVQGVIDRFHLLVPVPLAPSRQVEVQPLIVMVADPVETGLDWAHDQHMKAVRRAYEAAGFTLVHHDVPWVAGENGPTGSSKRPGFLVFNNQKEARIAPVFLVAESPTAGLTAAAAEALATAIQQESVLAKPPGDLRVVGPIFSGTRAALVHGLSSGSKCRRSVRVVSGSATVPTLVADMQKLGKQDGICDLQVSSTLMHDGDYEHVIEDIADRLGYSPEHCALIGERATQYGQASLGSSGFYSKCMHLPFPSHVTHLRAEYLARWQQENPQHKPSETISLALLDASNSALAPQPVSPLTDAVVDQRLTSALQKLRASGAKMAILLATDVRDKILLGREIARQVPDVTLVTTESNLLYLRRELASAQRGMLVVGSTALVPGNANKVMQTFASDAEAGVCAAVLRHLADTSSQRYLLAEVRYDILKEAAGIEPWLGKGVCVTCVGATQMLPVRFDDKPKIPFRADVEGFGVTSADGLRFSASKDWRLAAGVTFLALVVAVAAASVARRSRPSSKEGATLARSLCLTHGWCVALACSAIGLRVAAAGFVISCNLVSGLLTWTLCAMLAVSLFLVQPQPHALRRVVRQSKWPQHLLAGVGPFSVIGIAGLVGWAGCAAAGGRESHWYSERIRLAFELVSPVVPTIAVGSMVSYWVAAQLGRLRRSHDALPYDEQTKPSAGLWNSWPGRPVSVRQILTGEGNLCPAFLIACAGILLLFLYSMREHTTIEALSLDREHGLLKDPFGACYRFGFLVLMSAVMVGSARIVDVWRGLSRHMSQFDEPIRAALRRQAEHPEPAVETDLAAIRLRAERPSEVRRAWKAVFYWSAMENPGIHRLTSLDPSPRVRSELLQNVRALACPSRAGSSAGLDPVLADYVATEFCIWLRWVVGELKSIAKTMMLIMVASSIVLWVYPLHPQSTQTIPFLVASLTLLLTIVYLVIAMSANRVLSILTKTEPGHITFNRAFVNSFLVYVALPGLAFVAAQMPEFGAQLLGWVQPLLAAATTR